MGKAQSSFLRVEPFAALFCLSALYLPPPDPARRPGIAPCTVVQAACPFMAMLLVLRCRKISKIPHYFAHLGVINLWHVVLANIIEKVIIWPLPWVLYWNKRNKTVHSEFCYLHNVNEFHTAGCGVPDTTPAPEKYWTNMPRGRIKSKKRKRNNELQH